MLVPVQTARGILLLEAVPLEVPEQRRLNGDLILPDDQALILTDWLVLSVPWMLFDLLCGVSLLGVSLHDLCQQVLAGL